MSLVRRRYDKAYFDSLFGRSHPHSPRNSRQLDLILSHKPQGRLLEIGCGRGDFLELASSKFDVSAIDISPYAKTQLPSVLENRVMIGDIEEMQLPHQSYDVVTAFNVLEHLRNPSETIHKIRQSLAPDGIFFGSVPCNHGLIGSAYTRLTNFFDRTHCSCFKVSTWRKVFHDAGLPDTDFFGEIILDNRVCLYNFSRYWSQFSLNMMFLSHKNSSSAPA